ncbi:ATP synthase d subunit [Komagataella kurtzmanii]|nr:ATP synthase d subunit [Komagataella kurtzmanii]
MSSVAKQAATKLDWATVISKLGLTGSTAASLTSFKKRHDEAQRALFELKQQPTTVDVEFYKSTLKNQKIVSQVESDLKAFKPSQFPLDKQLNLIKSFEANALENAKNTETVVLDELEQLSATLANIEGARSFDELTVDDVRKARPDIQEKVNSMVTNHRWEVPGYKEKFGDLTIM